MAAITLPKSSSSVIPGSRLSTIAPVSDVADLHGPLDTGDFRCGLDPPDPAHHGAHVDRAGAGSEKGPLEHGADGTVRQIAPELHADGAGKPPLLLELLDDEGDVGSRLAIGKPAVVPRPRGQGQDRFLGRVVKMDESPAGDMNGGAIALRVTHRRLALVPRGGESVEPGDTLGRSHPEQVDPLVGCHGGKLLQARAVLLFGERQIDRRQARGVEVSGAQADTGHDTFPSWCATTPSAETLGHMAHHG